LDEEGKWALGKKATDQNFPAVQVPNQESKITQIAREYKFVQDNLVALSFDYSHTIYLLA
jgi:hypothetical protein